MRCPKRKSASGNSSTGNSSKCPTPHRCTTGFWCVWQCRWKLYSESSRFGVVLPKTDLAVRKDSRLRPDLGFFSAKTWATVDLTKVPVVQTPDIAIEIISPSETIATMLWKIEAYLKWGVHEVWLIFPHINTIFIHTLAQRLSEGTFLTSPYIPGWQIQVAGIFENL